MKKLVDIDLAMATADFFLEQAQEAHRQGMSASTTEDINKHSRMHRLAYRRYQAEANGIEDSTRTRTLN